MSRKCLVPEKSNGVRLEVTPWPKDAMLELAFVFTEDDETISLSLGIDKDDALRIIDRLEKFCERGT